jgi:hypothetical protein
MLLRRCARSRAARPAQAVQIAVERADIGVIASDHTGPGPRVGRAPPARADIAHGPSDWTDDSGLLGWQNEDNSYVEIMHWSHNKAGRWRCAVSGVTYQAYRVGDRRWMAEKSDPAGRWTPLGAYDTLKSCKVHAGIDYVAEMSRNELTSIRI